MIKFFRNIRRRLLRESRFTRYLLYAIGEIILVVIGILIALQVNNWNISNKIEQKEINTLKELRSSLKISKKNLEVLLINNERWLAYNYRIKDYLENQKPYDSTLDKCFGTYYWTGKAQLTTAPYDQLKIEGLDLIRNEQLRMQLVYVFEDYFGQIKSEHEEWDKDFLAEIIYPQHVDLFNKYYPEYYVRYSDEYAKPVDYQALLENERFLNTISENISLKRYSMTFKRDLIVKIDSLNKGISHEIEMLEK